MEKFNLKYFLAANSCEGFVSHFDSCYNPIDDWRAYIIKGGPGTGKSSFMKYLAVKAADLNIKVLLCPCSSDPDSLDAVIFPDKKIAVFDGTAPHTVDPKFPGACEQTLDFGKFWNAEILKNNRQKIIDATLENKALHRTAAGYLRATGPLLRDNFNSAANASDSKKIDSFASKLCKQYINQSDGTAYEWVRFLGGTTPKGVVAFGDTPITESNQTIVIEDEYGFVASRILENIRRHSLDCGLEVITLKNPFLPSVMTDGVIIPALSLSFVREYEFAHFKSDSRRIHARRFTNTAQISKMRQRLRFNKKAYREFLNSAAVSLGEAKHTHDILEKYYIEAMDFNALTKFASDFAKSLFE